MIETKIKELLEKKEFVIVSIDGCAASGKTTLAEKLKEQFCCSIIHMDDFFLPLEKRTIDRLNEPGGNIDYERFYDEVIKNLGSDINYGVFDCSVMKINNYQHVPKCKLLIIEGSYALHPYFGKYYDLSIFLDIDYDIQVDRIRKRNGEKMLKMFVDKWIKFEEEYHNKYNIKSIVDIYLK